jgi:2-polyprenyl-3-methyl-5-hydroxy-6-metoxy-1,4-benzoquinol methylase
MTAPQSPITKNNNTTLTDTFSAKDIISLYKQQLDIDVSRFFTSPSFYLFRCNDTGYRFYYPEGLDGDGKFYEALQNKLGKEYYHTWKFENQLAFDEIKPGDKVLDIGCGIGNFLIRAKEKTNNVVGLELNQNAVNVCRQKDLTVFNEMIQEHAATHEDYYDVVCMFQVLEHIYDVKDFLEASLKVLKRGGKIIIGVPNNEPYFLGYDKYCTLNLPPHHMGLWNKDVFKQLEDLFNLALLKTEYDTSGRIMAEAYLRAKYISNVKSLPGRHSVKEKLLMATIGLVTLPLTIIKKIIKGIHGSHIASVFEKK